jgi:hypothetical protein
MAFTALPDFLLVFRKGSYLLSGLEYRRQDAFFGVIRGAHDVRRMAAAVRLMNLHKGRSPAIFAS